MKLSQYNARQFPLSDHLQPTQKRRRNAVFTQRVLISLGRVMLLLLVLGALWSAWRWGRSQTVASYAHRDRHSQSLRVSGSSMVPTLRGDFEVARCDGCQLRWPVDPAVRHAALSKLICSHCGNPFQLDENPGIAGGAGDVVSIRQLASTQLRRGDLAAVDWEGQLRVKRIAALAGDVVDLDGLRLKVNGARLEDLLAGSGTAANLPEFLVDDDTRRATSRWSPTDKRSHWTRTPQRQWMHRSLGDSDWLAYDHQSAHDHNRRSQVWDDYPFNVTLDRKMHEVDRFRVRGKVDCESNATLEIALWSRSGSRRVTVTASGPQAFNVSYFDAAASDALPVHAKSPVAIRVSGGPTTIAELSIHRLIEYRLRPHDDRHRYPLQVGPGQCYLVGDNVPVSVDSRDIGLVPCKNIFGVVLSESSAVQRPQ